MIPKQINRDKCYVIIYNACEMMNRRPPKPEDMFFLTDLQLDKMRLKFQLEARDYMAFIYKRAQCSSSC